MSSGTSMSDLCKSFFDSSASPTSPALDLDRFQEKVYILLGWAMSLFTLGVHRPYAICTLLKLWHDERTAYLAKGNGQTDIDVFPALYNWLDTSAPARNSNNVLAIGITFGELTRSGMFSYGRYIRTLIAQGKTARCAESGSPITSPRRPSGPAHLCRGQRSNVSATHGTQRGRLGDT